VLDVYLITDGPSATPIVEAVQRALRGIRGGPHRIAVQLRAKTWPHAEIVRAGHALRAVTRETGSKLLVNSDVIAAGAVQADGVHLPDDATPIGRVRDALGPHALVGRSCHDAAGLARAAAEGASFATLSPVYAVAGKGPALGVDHFGDLVHEARLPVLALGGIRDTHVAALMTAGACGVALRGHVLHASDPSAALRALLVAIDHARVLDTARDASGRSSGRHG